jgi:hypothetical protein
VSRTGKLRWRSLQSGALLKHDWNAILHGIIAAASSAMQPCVRGLAGAGVEPVMAYRTDKDLKQVGREKRRHAMSLDHSITMSAAGRMVDE